MKKKRLTWALIIFLLPALACSLGGGGDESASSDVSFGADETAQAAPTQPPVEEDVEELEEEETTTESAQPESAPLDATTSTGQLDSFRMNTFLEFTGATGQSTGDETTSQRQEYMLEVTRNPTARHQITTIKSEGAIETDVQSEYFMIDDVTYTSTLGNWIAQAGLIGQSQFISPEQMVPVPDTATCDPEPEEVNGISAIHCIFTEQDNVAHSLDAATIQGDIWIAQEGNYVVKYNLEAQNVNLKGKFNQGFSQFETYGIGYELSDINADISITLPPEAEGTQIIDVSDSTGGSSGLNVPPSAEVFLDSPSGLNYFSTASLQTLVDFHREDLTAAGWQEDPTESFVDEHSALLVFENETGIMRVFIYRDIDGGYFVSITLPFEPPDITGGGSGDTGDGSTGSGGGAEASSDMPVLDDATDLFSTGQVTTYYTALDVAAVVEFYRAELPALGWTEDTGTSFSNESTALLNFNKDGATLTLAVNQEEEGRVNVSMIQQ